MPWLSSQLEILTHFLLVLPLLQGEEELIATFSGSEFLHYNFTVHGEAIVSERETISLSFKTTDGDGLLFYTGDDTQYLNVGLYEGVIYLAVDMGDGEKVDLVGTGRQFDDNYWHELVISRQASELTRALGRCTVSINVDRMYEASRSFAGHFSQLVSRVLYVGGAMNLRKLSGSRATQNFRGCLKEVKFVADSLPLLILKQANAGSPFISQHGDLDMGDTCQPVKQSKSVSILHSQDRLLLQKLSTSKTKFISLTFKTTVKDGLLLYTVGEGSVFALELLEGYLYLIVEHVEVTVRRRVGNEPVDNGTNMHVYVTLKNSGISIELNGNMPETISLGDRRSPALKLTSPVSLAGLALTDSGMHSHPAVYTSQLQKGFVGCLKDVKIDGMYQDLRSLAREQGIRVSASCNQSEQRCSRNRCMNGGTCVQLWQSASCNCHSTAYSGQLCTEETPVVRFNGRQQVMITPQVKWVTLAEDILLQFRTSFSHGALLNSRSKNRRSGLDMFLHHGQLFIRVTLVGMEHMLSVEENLNDNEWHSLIFKRRAQQVKITLDNYVAVDEELPTAVGQHSWLDQVISMDEIKLGQPIDGDNSNSASYDESAPTSQTSFIGHMRQLVINNIEYFEIVHQGGNKDVTFTAELSSDPIDPLYPVTFGSADTFVMERLAGVVRHTAFSLQLNTHEADGLILYRAGQRQDFLALEMVQGSLYYHYSLRGRVGSVQARHHSRIDDGRWHDVIVMTLSNGTQSMSIDGAKYISQTSAREDFRLSEQIYIAGVPREIQTRLQESLLVRKGYKGCIASLDINGLRLDLTRYQETEIKLGEGCFDPSACMPNPCHNSGVCVESWPQVNCSCDMTTFSGPTCADDATTYDFGRVTGGLVEYTFPTPQPDTMRDNLAIGFITSMRTRATILKIVSSNSADFLEIYISDGRINAEYNIGGETRILTHLSPVNDRLYHTLRFTRKGYNSTLQIDDNNKILDTPQVTDSYSLERPTSDADAQLRVFNSQSHVYLGGYLASTGAIASPFVGQLSGVNLNGLGILEIAKDDHQGITLQGDAQMVNHAYGVSDLMIRDMSKDADMGKNSGEILILATEKPACIPGLDADVCNTGTGSGEILDRKISVTNIVSGSNTKPPTIVWPGGEPPTIHRMRTTKPAKETSSRQDTSYQQIREFKTPSTHGPFDLKRNLPLIAGICGAALMTVILIAVIIYRLTRRDNHNYSNNHRHQPRSSIDDDLKNSINGHRIDVSTPHMPLPLNGSSQQSGSKEWYV